LDSRAGRNPSIVCVQKSGQVVVGYREFRQCASCSNNFHFVFDLVIFDSRLRDAGFFFVLRFVPRSLMSVLKRRKSTSSCLAVWKMCPKRAECGENPIFVAKIEDFCGEIRCFQYGLFQISGFFCVFFHSDAAKKSATKRLHNFALGHYKNRLYYIPPIP